MYAEKENGEYYYKQRVLWIFNCINVCRVRKNEYQRPKTNVRFSFLGPVKKKKKTYGSVKYTYKNNFGGSLGYLSYEIEGKISTTH